VFCRCFQTELHFWFRLEVVKLTSLWRFTALDWLSPPRNHG
jgi:hypothetical protein